MMRTHRAYWASVAVLSALLWGGVALGQTYNIEDYFILSSGSWWHYTGFTTDEGETPSYDDDFKWEVVLPHAEIPDAQAGLLTTTGGAQLRFSDLVDADDLTGASLPLVGGPAVLDAAFAQVRRLRVVQAEGYQNQLWLPVELETQDGRQLAARLPALYPGSGRHEEPLVRIGRMTLWSHLEGVAVAYGQRDLKLISADGGCRMIGIWQVAELELDATASPARKGFFGRLFS